MNKNIYSIVLFDELVEALDQLAYKKSINRSQLINELLAEQLGLLTPNKKIRILLERLKEQLNEMKYFRVKSKENQLELGTFIKYKYNPAIKYHIELCSKGQNKHILLKVSSRTTSSELIQKLNHFFEIISEIDIKRFQEIYGITINNKISDNTNYKFIRQFMPNTPFDNLEVDNLSTYVYLYIKMIDTSLKYYFSHLNDDQISKMMDKIYCDYMGQLSL